MCIRDRHTLVLLAKKGLEFRCVLVGTGMSRENQQLAKLIRQLSLEDRLILTGPRNDIPDVMNALDLHVLSSAGEAFPNTVAEAMACGTPCVVTDVGDAALIVGDTGWIAPPQNPAALAERVEQGLVTLQSEGPVSYTHLDSDGTESLSSDCDGTPDCVKTI